MGIAMFNLQHIALTRMFLAKESAATDNSGLWATGRRRRGRHAGREALADRLIALAAWLASDGTREKSTTLS